MNNIKMTNLLNSEEFIDYIENVFFKAIEKNIFLSCRGQYDIVRAEAINDSKETIDDYLYETKNIDNDEERERILSKVEDYLDNVKVAWSWYEDDYELPAGFKDL